MVSGPDAAIEQVRADARERADREARLSSNPETGLSRIDTSMGVLFLSLLNRQGAGVYDGADPDNPDQTLRETAALHAYQNWRIEIERRMRLTDPNDTLIDHEVTEQMAFALNRQLLALNGGRTLSAEAVAEIDRLMDLGPDEFAEAIRQHGETAAEAAAEHQRQVAAAQAEGRDPPGMPLVGIMAILMQPNEHDQVPSGLNNAETVDISPDAQTQTSWAGAFRSMADFATMRNGAETAIARLHGVSWETNGLRYEGINYIQGLHLARGNREAALDAFVNGPGLRPEGYALTDTMEPGTGTMDQLFTQALIDRGLLSFGEEVASPEEIDLARADWNAVMGEVLREGIIENDLDSRDLSQALMERMEAFAEARRDITMSTEPEETRGHGMTAAEARMSAEELAEHRGLFETEGTFETDTPLETAGTFETDPPLETEGTFETDAPLETAGTRAQFENGEPAFDPSVPPAIEAAEWLGGVVDDHYARNDPDADASYSIQMDPRSAYAVELYGADPGIAPMVSATVDAQIARFESVPGFLAAMRGYEQGQAVPSFSPLADLVGQPEANANLPGPSAQ